eukprot:scaffold113915_cov15-Prasinocladus_malaysianus.AAC.1
MPPAAGGKGSMTQQALCTKVHATGFIVECASLRVTSDATLWAPQSLRCLCCRGFGAHGFVQQGLGVNEGKEQPRLETAPAPTPHVCVY